MLRSSLRKYLGASLVLLVSLGLSISPTFANAVENNKETTPTNSLLKNSKVATPLDKNLETKISISFPGKQEVLPSDIVFVLDKSGASAKDAIFVQAKKFLSEIKEQAEKRGLSIKVGVVLFNYLGNVQQELVDITSGYDAIMEAMDSSVNMGTNMQAGLLAAKDILDKDTKVAAANKHVVVISDGATYLYCKDGDYKKAYTRSFGDPTKQTDPETNKPYSNGGDKKGGIWEYQSREYNTKERGKFSDGSEFRFSNAMKDPKRLGEYLDYYRVQENDGNKNWKQYEYRYTFSSAYLNRGRKVTPVNVDAPANIDIAFLKTDETFQNMVNAGYHMNLFFKNAADFDGTTFMQYLARKSNNGQLNTDFAQLKKEVLDKIAKGSYVEDYMGTDFDFVNDVEKISLRVGTENLTPEKISDNKYGFGKLMDGTYRFKLSYSQGEKEKFTLNVYETIFPTKPVVLEYVEKLVHINPNPGMHSYRTNEKATLTPVDGNGKVGQAVEFAIPEVKLENPLHPSPVDPLPAPTPTPAQKVPAQKVESLPKTGINAIPLLLISAASILSASIGISLKNRMQKRA